MKGDQSRSNTSIAVSGDSALSRSERRQCGSAALRDDLTGDVATHVGESKIAAAVSVGQLLVIDPHQVQEGGMQIMDVHRVLDSGVANLIGGAVDHAALDAAAG